MKLSWRCTIGHYECALDRTKKNKSQPQIRKIDEKKGNAHTTKKNYPVPIEIFLFFSVLYCTTTTDFLATLSLSIVAGLTLYVTHSLCTYIYIFRLYSLSFCVYEPVHLFSINENKRIIRFCQNQSAVAYSAIYIHIYIYIFTRYCCFFFIFKHRQTYRRFTCAV